MDFVKRSVPNLDTILETLYTDAKKEIIKKQFVSILESIEATLSDPSISETEKSDLEKEVRTYQTAKQFSENEKWHWAAGDSLLAIVAGR